jgi:hypothetical protein
LAKWLGGSYLCWEANGPGASFGRQVLLREYANVYYRRSMMHRGQAVTKQAGWWTDENTKEMMFGDLQSSVISNQLVIRSRHLLAECNQYVRKDGRISHPLSKNAAADSVGASHGDRAIAACVARQGVRDRPVANEESEEAIAPPNSPMWRFLEYQRAAAGKVGQDGWTESIFAWTAWCAGGGHADSISVRSAKS